MSLTEMMRGKAMPVEKKNDIKMAQHGERYYRGSFFIDKKI